MPRTQMNVDGALTAVLNGGRREADDNGAQIRFFEPARHVTFQHATLTIGLADVRRLRANRFALAGDDENIAKASRLAAHQKSSQSRMRFVLAHAMQINARFDVETTAANLPHAVAIEKCKLRRCLASRFDDGRFNLRDVHPGLTCSPLDARWGFRFDVPLFDGFARGMKTAFGALQRLDRRRRVVPNFMIVITG